MGGVGRGVLAASPWWRLVSVDGTAGARRLGGRVRWSGPALRDSCVSRAAQAAAADLDFDSIKALAGNLVEQVHVHAVIVAVDYLVRGGRAGLLDTHGVKQGASQVVAIRGHAIPLRQVRGRRRAIDELLSHVAEHAEHGIGRWAVGHGDATDIDEFVSRATQVLESEPEFVVLLGPSVGAHVGPDALVLGFLSS